MKYKAKLITFEGMEGCGKSTQVKLLAAAFRKRNIPVLVLREPGGTVISEKIRGLLLDKKHTRMASGTELLLYCAARAQLVEEKIRPALAKGITVICDRYVDSTLAYQAIALKMDFKFTLALCNFATRGLKPDTTLLIDVPVKTGLGRSGRTDRMEARSLEYHERVRKGFLALAKREPGRFRVFDGTRSIEVVQTEILNKVFNQKIKK